MRKQLCGRLWSVRNFEFLLRRLSKCWCPAQMVFSLSRNVSSVTAPGLKHSSSNMAKMPFWFWTVEEEEEKDEEEEEEEKEGGTQNMEWIANPKALHTPSICAVFDLCELMITAKLVGSGGTGKLTFSIRSQITALLKYSMFVHSMPCNKRNEGQTDNSFSIIQA